MNKSFTSMLAALVLVISSLITEPATRATTTQATGEQLWPNSLCARSEQVVFACVVRRAKSRAGIPKIVSLCASKKLTRDEGYLQYRFGLPSKIELTFPSTRTGTQQMFQYTHYMRFQVDLSEINFTIGDHQYQIFDSYNGEEKLAISEEGVNVTMPDGTTNATFNCRTRAKADYSMLDDVLRGNE